MMGIGIRAARAGFLDPWNSPCSRRSRPAGRTHIPIRERKSPAGVFRQQATSWLRSSKGHGRTVASGWLARYEPTQGRSPSASAPSRNGGQEPHDQNSITGRHVPGRGRAARRPGHAVHRLDRAPTTRWRGRLGPLVMGAAACFVRTMTGAGGSMRGRSAPPRAALLTLLAHLCMASAARWRGRAGRAVPAACVAAVPAAGLRALAAAPTRSGV